MSASADQLESKDSSRGGDANKEFDQIVENVRKHVLEGLGALLDGMFDGADDTLFALAEKAENNNLQQIYFETMRMLRLERTNIKHVFAAEMGSSFDPTTRKFATGEDSGFDEDELSLVDQDVMEEMVAITGMQTKAMQMFKEELLHLGKRLQFVGENSRIMFQQEAIEPKNICEAFRDAIAPIGEQMEIQNKLILYKLFDNKLVCNLGGLYKEINQSLINAGVMPKISVSQLVGNIGGGGRPGSQAITRADHALARLQAFEESNYRQYRESHPDALDYQSVQVLSDFLQEPAGKGSLAAQAEQMFTTADVLQGLSKIQSTATSGAPLTQGEIKSALHHEIGKLKGDMQGFRVSQLDEKTIDLIQLLFDAMIEDESVAEFIKSLLLRLQIPVIKSAMLDSAFFVVRGKAASQLTFLHVYHHASMFCLWWIGVRYISMFLN